MQDLIYRHFSLRALIRILLTVIIVGAFLFYAAFQARLIITGPTIKLKEELHGIQRQEVVTVVGIAENIVSLSLNDRPIFTDDKGNFSEILVLPPGYTIMTLKAKDRYGRETIYTKRLVYIKTSNTDI